MWKPWQQPMNWQLIGCSLGLLFILNLAGILVPALMQQAKAQCQLQVLVTDTANVPLSGAVLSYSKGRSAAGFGYTTTNAAGAAILPLPAQLPTDTLLLHVRLLGFAAYTRRVQCPAAGSAPPSAIRAISVVLREATTRLHEVVVTANRPGISYNDTTTYDAKTFGTGTERTLEDLLKNVPGFTVSPDGSISYKGTSISGLYVEGENLTGANYQRLARNFDASLVEKIQPVEQFVENPLLGGLVRSETTVLNITIPAEKKGKLFGSVSASGAWPRYRDITANVFSYGQRSKLFVVGTHNNVGLEQDPVANALSSPLAKQVLRNEIEAPPLLLLPPPLGSSSFRPDLSRLNNETTMGLIHVYKPAGGVWKLLTDASLYLDRRHQRPRLNSRYLLPENDFLFLGETNDVRQTVRVGRLRNNLFVALGKQANLTYENRLSSGRYTAPVHSQFETLRPDSSLTEAVRQVFGRQPFQLGQNLLLTQRFSPRAALQTQLTHIYDDLPQQLVFESDLPARRSAYLGLPLTDGPLQQQVATRQHAVSGEAEYFRTGRAVNFTLVLGTEYVATELRTSLRVPAGSADTLAAPYANALRVRRQLMYGQVRFDRRWGRLTLSGAAGAATTQLAIRQPGTMQQQRYAYPLARLTAQVAMSPNSTLRLAYSFEQQFSTPTQLLARPVLVDFRTALLGLPQLVAQPQHTLRLNFNHLNPARLTEIRADAYYTAVQASLSPQVLIDELLTRSALFVGPVRRSAGANALAAQLLDALSTRVQLSGSLLYTETFSQLNSSALRRNNYWVAQQQLQLGTAFAGPLNLFGGATLVSSRVQSHLPAAERLTSRNTSVQLNGQLNFRRNKTTAALKTDQLFINQNSYFFLGAEARYVPTKGRLTYTATLKNMLNTRTFSQVLISPIVTTSTSFDLLPRLVLVGASYQF